jgi:hypothetical protein
MTNSPSQTQVLAAELFQMSGHDSEDHNSASIPESTPTDVQLISLGGTVDLAAAQGDQEAYTEEHGDGSPVDSDAIPPPLGVKLTAYRLLNMATMFAFCFAKGILSYEGLSTIPTTLDWFSGWVLGLV